MSALVFNLPLPPNIPNARMHWKAKMRARQAYESACEMLRLTRQLPPVPATPIARATVSAHFVTWSPCDEDNLAARAKWSLDWIVKAGYLADDRKKCLSWTGMPTQSIDRKAMGLIVTLTPGHN